MPKHKCMAIGCSNQIVVADDVRVYKFPSDREETLRWMENLRIPGDVDLPKGHGVCSKHFETSELGSKYLKKGAIPTLNLGYVGQPPHSSSCMKYFRNCCIKTCNFSGKLYPFPKAEVARRVWIRACSLKGAPAEFKNIFICKRHFPETYFIRKKLKKDAVPELYLEQEPARNCSETSDRTLQPVMPKYGMNFEHGNNNSEELEASQLSEEREGLTSPYSSEYDYEEGITEMAKDYKQNAFKQDTKIADLQAQIQALKLENISLKNQSIHAHADASEDAILFARMIVGAKKSDYTEEEIALAQNVNYLSTKAYSVMREEFGFRLPHKTILLRERPIRFVSAGIDNKLIENLKKIVSTMEKNQKICQIIFDEINIRKDLVYNQVTDCIDGYVDNGEGNRENVLGNKCLFFMVKGLCSSWKYVLSYYVSKDGYRADSLIKLLEQNINVTEEIGLKVKAVISGQGSSNISMYRKLGISKQSTFMVGNQGKIHFMYDYCHLIKSLMSTFLHYDIQTPDGVASFNVIKKIYDIDKNNNNFKICPKLTESHIYPSYFERMGVSRATQVLSNSVSAGIDVVIKEELLGDDEYLNKCARPTQMFVKRMNDLFDELDSKDLYTSNPYKRPMYCDSFEKVERMEGHIRFLESLKVPKEKKVQCIGGFILTIKSMLNLCKDIFQTEKDISFVYLGKLNLDALENVFYKIRASQGISHPTAHEVQFIVARLNSMQILRQRFTKRVNNCEDNDEELLDWDFVPENPRQSRELNASCCFNSALDQEEFMLNESLDLEEFDLNDPLELEEFGSSPLHMDIDDEKDPLEWSDGSDMSLEECTEAKPAEFQVQRYYAGYAIYAKLVHKIQCSKCTNLMKETTGNLQNSSEELIRDKNYKEDDRCLVNSEDSIFLVCHRQMTWYQQFFEEYGHKIGVAEMLISDIKKKTDDVFPTWFWDEDECLEHRLQLLRFLVIVLLYKNSKWIAQKEQAASRHNCRAKRKLKNLTT